MLRFTTLIKCDTCEVPKPQRMGSHQNRGKTCTPCYKIKNQRKNRDKKKLSFIKPSKEQRLAEYRDYRGHKRAILGATRKYYMLYKKQKFNLRENDLMQIPGYELLWNHWVSSGYKEEFTPMITKFDPKQPYDASNVQWVTFGEVGYVPANSAEMEEIDKLAKSMDDINRKFLNKPKIKKRVKETVNV